eukprot:1790188-Amphidinium_carterae.2
MSFGDRRMSICAMEWLQYTGLMEGARAETLILIQLPVRKTRPRSSGPGPLRKTDCPSVFAGPPRHLTQCNGI